MAACSCLLVTVNGERSRALRWQLSCAVGGHAGSHADERHRASPDFHGQPPGTTPRSRTDPNGSGCPHMELGIRGSCPLCTPGGSPPPDPAIYGLAAPSVPLPCVLRGRGRCSPCTPSLPATARTRLDGAHLVHGDAAGKGNRAVVTLGSGDSPLSVPGGPPLSRAPEDPFKTASPKASSDPPLSVGAPAPPPVSNQGPGQSLPRPDAGHPLQGAGGHGQIIEERSRTGRSACHYPGADGSTGGPTWAHRGGNNTCPYTADPQQMLADLHSTVLAEQRYYWTREDVPRPGRLRQGGGLGAFLQPGVCDESGAG
jgi:hypothetical protein